MKERVLITGAGGFLGSHVARYLGASGHVIAAVGRFVASPDYAKNVPNLWNLCGMTLPDSAFPTVVAAFKPTVLIHCAGTASVANSVLAPYSDFRRTVDVCAFTLETLRTEAPDCRFVFLSSASVYGNPLQLPIQEKDALCPVSPYGYHKMLCETLTAEYAALYGLKTVVLRIFSAFGERLRRQVVYDSFRKFCDPDSPIVELSGSGNESRDFIHAQDVAHAIDVLIHARATGIYNCAAGRQTTIAELVRAIACQTASNKHVQFNGIMRAGDPLHWQADISALSAYGFTPHITLSEGLARVQAWIVSEGLS